MKRVVYHKLVRDKIPQIIRESGRTCETRVLAAEEYREALCDKLREETAEYLKSGELDELADLMEVVYALAQADGYGARALDAARARKAAARGVFAEKILLLSTDGGKS